MGNRASPETFNETLRALKRQEQLWDMQSDILMCGSQRNMWDLLFKTSKPHFSPRIGGENQSFEVLL